MDSSVILTPVTVATINIHNRADRWLKRRHLLVGAIVQQMPELVSLQEVSASIRQGNWLRKQINYRLSGSGRGPYRLVQRRRTGLFDLMGEGIAILSRLPILYHDSIELGYSGRVALRAHVELPSHQTMDFVATQLHHVSYDREARQEQAMKLMSWLQSHKHVPIQVIAGDLNEPPEGLAVRYCKQSFRSVYADVYGREPLATFPTALAYSSRPAVCLDYILVSNAVQRVAEASLFCDKHDREDDTLYPSNHVGLIARLEVRISKY